MFQFRTLADTSIDNILAAFNKSFSDYITPLQLTMQQLEAKIASDNIDLSISPGAFVDGELVGFILHGYRFYQGKHLAYNAGTGVIPSQRGQGLTTKLYEFVMPLLMERGVEELSLEVITENKPALAIYEKTGFKKTRLLHCYRGAVKTIQPDAYEVLPLENYDWPLLQSFWDMQPSWQNAIPAMEALQAVNRSVCVYLEGILRGYLIFNPAVKRVQQFAIDPAFRHRGLATAMFSRIVPDAGGQVSVINVDADSTATTGFLESIGLQRFVSQYEMVARVATIRGTMQVPV